MNRKAHLAALAFLVGVACTAPTTVHPRTSGTHGKSLRLARENNIPWMHIIELLSYNSAKHLGDAGIESMKKRGRLQEGMVADITVFNPETVTENSGFAEGKNGLPTTGIPYVLVTAVVVVDDSKVLEGATPGQPIRYPVETESRFVSLRAKAVGCSRPSSRISST